MIAIYTPVNTNPVILPDCSNPLNDPSCAGYAEAIAALQAAEEPKPPTFAEQATNVVFGDSPDDFLFLDQPDRTGKPRALKQAEAPKFIKALSKKPKCLAHLLKLGLHADDAPPQNPEIMYLEAVEEPTQTVERLPSLEKQKS